MYFANGGNYLEDASKAGVASGAEVMTPFYVVFSEKLKGKQTLISSNDRKSFHGKANSHSFPGEG